LPEVGFEKPGGVSFYDLVVVGAGPAGLAAAVYGAADGLHTLTRGTGSSRRDRPAEFPIENYLRFFRRALVETILPDAPRAQGVWFGVEILTPQEVCGVRVEGPTRVLKLSDGGRWLRALLIATGTLSGSSSAGLERTQWSRRVLLRAHVRGVFLSRRQYLHRRGHKLAAERPCIFFFPKFARQVTMLVARQFFVRLNVAVLGKTRSPRTKNIEVNELKRRGGGSLTTCERITIQTTKRVPRKPWRASPLRNSALDHNALAATVSVEHVLLSES